jgi:diaminohydroxyphosphoribosylaminopyrimidine deaminase/5-amino-6-(5-phosphoribosylamino)uracil reductase
VFSATDSAHMARALQLAARGRYGAHPNPMVGCVIVRDGDVVGEGWHAQAGEAHAEIGALEKAGERARGATAYVTLEPCAHHGKTPPCADALVEAGVSRVVVAMQDPYDEVAGRGLARLLEAGIETEVGLMQAAAEALNEGFIGRVTRGRPFVRLKVAASLDGATAMACGESQWITGSEARRDVHRLRAQSGAIMTGIGTVLADDPSLTVRDIDAQDRQPLRVVLDSRLRMPPDARMLSLPGGTLVCCTSDHDDAALVAAGAEVLVCGAHGDVVNVFEVLAALAEREINDVLVEAGHRLAGYLLEKDLVDELVIYQSPHIMGSNTRGMFATPAWEALADRRGLSIKDVRRIGNDTRITARLEG